MAGDLACHRNAFFIEPCIEQVYPSSFEKYRNVLLWPLTTKA